mmetsp:Transcript_31382/g.89051  ORF Transcript_31382/g.89051 Transcript_31382/m.89051 type:complete len:89 (+) Transcript_31382:72-338(+)
MWLSDPTCLDCLCACLVGMGHWLPRVWALQLHPRPAVWGQTPLANHGVVSHPTHGATHVKLVCNNLCGWQMAMKALRMAAFSGKRWWR